MGTLKAFFLAATAALWAFPFAVLWRISEQLESLTDEIIILESRADPHERPRLERLRVKKTNTRKQYDALLAIVTALNCRANDPDKTRPVSSSGG